MDRVCFSFFFIILTEDHLAIDKWRSSTSQSFYCWQDVV